MTTQHSHPSWLNEAAFYEIYPQTFYDSNNDGIGDIPGITAKLDYIQKLGCNAIWINPCFTSPFKDAGYDVSNYYEVAPRYGSNEDLIQLFTEAHRRNIHVLLDLVPGHTSEEHPWFQASQKDEKNEYSDRYIWTTNPFEGYSMPFIGGESERGATYILNFFKCQPALNYGFAKVDRSWQMSTDSPAAQATRQAMVDVMKFWLSQGCDGFRVDMAYSLVKNDGDDKKATIQAWQDMISCVKKEYPQSAFISEWGDPVKALQAGFDMDFYLDVRNDGKGNGYNLLARNTDDPLDRLEDKSYFNADSKQSAHAFLDDYLPQYENSKDMGGFCFISCNHDTPRWAPRLSDRERKIAFAFITTMPGAPFIYYGDEIGMRYQKMISKEGGYYRTGSRTPMQWDHSSNLGFSKATAEDLYLPVDSSSDAPTVADQEDKEDSMLTWVKQLINIRKKHSSLQANAQFTLLSAPNDGRSLVYLRSTRDQSERTLIALNPGRQTEHCLLNQPLPLDGGEPDLRIGTVDIQAEHIELSPQSAAIIVLNGISN